MRIAHFIHRLPREYSGAATQAAALVGRLSRSQNIACSIVAYSQSGTEPDPSVPCEQFVVPIGRGVSGKALQLIRLFAALRSTRSDILHVHGFNLPAVVFGMLTFRKIVLKTTLLGTDDLESLKKRYPVVFRFVVLPLVDAVISLTGALARANADAGRKNHLIPNGVNWEDFATEHSREEESARARFGIPPDRILFLFVGGDSARKGFHELPMFWNKIGSELGDGKAHLLVVGRFLSAGSSEQLLERCNSNSVTVVPEVVDLRPILKATDIFVSLSLSEGLPNAVLEAAASDVFVLARNLPGAFDEILDRDNSLLFESLDSQVLAGLKELVRERRYQRVDNSRYAARFDLSLIADSYRRLYDSLLGGYWR
jgi:glycosyltransferase involved in cell wall biosynthesis